MNEVKDKSEEMKRFAANVVIAGTDVLEVFNPALQSVPGILYWNTLSVVGRLRRVNGANDCVERTVEALRFVGSLTFPGFVSFSFAGGHAMVGKLTVALCLHV